MSAATDHRRVAWFDTMDGALADQRERPDTILVDLHGLWWSVPTELTIQQVDEQVRGALHAAGLAVFPDAYHRWHRNDWPATPQVIRTTRGWSWMCHQCGTACQYLERAEHAARADARRHTCKDGHPHG